MTTEEMKDALEAYYEAAGFAEFYERKLRNMSDENVAQLYRNTFEDLD